MRLLMTPADQRPMLRKHYADPGADWRIASERRSPGRWCGRTFLTDAPDAAYRPPSGSNEISSDAWSPSRRTWGGIS